MKARLLLGQDMDMRASLKSEVEECQPDIELIGAVIKLIRRKFRSVWRSKHRRTPQYSEQR